MDEEVRVDQTKLAEDVSNKIHFEFREHFLVKPLDPVMVTKEFTKLPEDKPATEDKNGIEAVDVKEEEMIKEVKEVESDYRKAVVLKVPYDYQKWLEDVNDLSTMPIKVGDVVVYKDRNASWFDLLKDSQLVRHYDILAIER